MANPLVFGNARAAGCKPSKPINAQQLCVTYNNMLGRNDVVWTCDSFDNIRLERCQHDSQFSRFMFAAQDRRLSRDDIYHAGLRWKQIAAEYGFLREVGDNVFEVRPKSGYELRWL